MRSEIAKRGVVRAASPFERHRAAGARRAGDPRTSDPESAFPESASPRSMVKAPPRAGKAAFDRLLGPSLSRSRSRPTSATSRASGARSASCSGATYPARHRWLVRRGRARARPVEKGRSRTWAGACRKSFRASTRRASRSPIYGDAHVGSGVHDGVPGGGPHAQDRGLEAVAYAWDEVVAGARQRRNGKSRRGRTSRSGWRSAFASCRAASASSSWS